MQSRFSALAVVVFCLFTGAFASADTPASPPVLPTIPPELRNNPYVQSLINSLGGILQNTNGNTAQGKVASFKRFELQVETAPHVYRVIHLHRGTVINPQGGTLLPGQTVEVSGAAQSDGALNASVITIR